MAKGSHATFGEYPRVCASCDQPVRMKAGFLVFQWTPKYGYQSWHVDCWPLRKCRLRGEFHVVSGPERGGDG